METQCVTDAGPSAIIFRPPSYIERLDVPALFARPQPIEVELGAGDGSFFVQWAALNPDVNFLGVERLLGRLKKNRQKIQARWTGERSRPAARGQLLRGVSAAAVLD